VLTVRKNGTSCKAQKFANTPADRARLVKKMLGMPGIVVCLEATGVTHFDLSLALHDAGVGADGGPSEVVSPLRQGVDEKQQDGCCRW
jgi:transposase